MLPKVSIIITTKNEENNIGNCLESIKQQTYPKKFIEIIVVDNNSFDKTKEIAKKYTKDVFDFGPERSAQRNFGMLKKSSGKYVIYLDADMILSSVLIKKSILKLERENIVALYVPEIILGNSYWGRVRRFERSFYDGTSVDCVRIIKTDVFKKSKGFDEKITGPEDWDLDKKIRKMGKTGISDNYLFEEVNEKLSGKSRQIKEIFTLIPKAVIYHNEENFNLIKYLSKKNYYSKSFSTYKQKWGTDDSDIKKQFGFLYRYFLIFTENSKWKKTIRHLKLIIGILFFRILVGIVYLFN